MVGGNGAGECDVPDLESADPVAHRDRPHARGARSDVGGHLGHDLLRARVSAVLQAAHGPAAVVVTHHAGERHHGACGGLVDERGVLRHVERRLSDGSPQDCRSGRCFRHR
jgi:hypothetical protein